MTGAGIVDTGSGERRSGGSDTVGRTRGVGVVVATVVGGVTAGGVLGTAVAVDGTAGGALAAMALAVHCRP